MIAIENERIKNVIKLLKSYRKIADQKQLAQELGYARQGTVSDIINSDTVNTKFVKALCSTYGVNEDYIMNGDVDVFNRNPSPLDGDVGVNWAQQGFQNDTIQLPDAGTPYKSKGGNEFVDLGSGWYQMQVQLVTQKSAAGYLTGWGDQEYLEELPIISIMVKQPHKGTYRGFEIGQNNVSMDDGTKRSIAPGDVVIGRLISRSLWATSKLHLNSWSVYTIIHKTEGITTKEIIAHDVEAGTITCRSYNPDFKDFTLNLVDIIQLWNAVKIERTL